MHLKFTHSWYERHLKYLVSISQQRSEAESTTAHSFSVNTNKVITRKYLNSTGWRPQKNATLLYTNRLFRSYRADSRISRFVGSKKRGDSRRRCECRRECWCRDLQWPSIINKTMINSRSRSSSIGTGPWKVQAQYISTCGVIRFERKIIYVTLKIFTAH